MQRYVNTGLDLVPLDNITQQIADLGFNCIRYPFSLELFYKDPIVQSEAIAANPELIGMTGMQIFDRTIKSLTDRGVMVILNNHISDAMWCCDPSDGNGAWYNKNYTEQ